MYTWYCGALGIPIKVTYLNFLEKKLHRYVGTTYADLLSLQLVILLHVYFLWQIIKQNVFYPEI